MDARVSTPQPVTNDTPFVVVGSGPSGLRVVHEIARRKRDASIVWYGAEPWEPYNRVKLSSFLAGDVRWASVIENASIPDHVDCRFGCRVVEIDRGAKAVVDSLGRRQPYAHLVLATGSHPHIPSIEGTALAGVYTLRDMNDAQALLARSVRTRVCVVIGGGLLGLEAARGMRRHNTEVWVIEHADRLMPRQLDRDAASVLAGQIGSLGIHMKLESGVRAILGETAVEGVMLRDGETIACDTVIVATGIVPAVELALGAGLPIGRGIKVDDRMLTADPAVSAIGECAEHGGIVHGLVAPGLEQAAVAAEIVTGGEARYEGSVAATNLKVLGCKVFSIGEVERAGAADIARGHVHSDAERGIYRKLLVRNGRLVGAVGVGEWPERSRLQEAVRTRRRVWPWQTRAFARQGRLWAEEDGTDVMLWPGDATICNCTGVTKGALEQAVKGGCRSVEALCASTGAGSVCGSCRPLLAELAGGQARLPALAGWKVLFGLTLVAGVLGLLYALLAIPFPDSAEREWRWDVIWRDKSYKQVSGYSAIALMAALALLGLRKRWARLALGSFDGWRVVHVLIGALLVLFLFVHTGGRLGNRLDFVFSLSALLALLSGTVIAAVLARQHDLAPRVVRSAQRATLWTHILSLWVLPVLLGYHILRTYYF